MMVRMSQSVQTEGTAIIIMGDAGVGKTTLVRGLNPDRTLLVPFDPGYDVLAGWNGHRANLDETDTKSVGTYIAWLTLNARTQGIATVIVDNVSYLERWTLRALTEFHGKQAPDLQEQGPIGAIVGGWLMSLRDLRKQGINVVFFAHDKTDMKGFEGVHYPSLQDKLSRNFCGMVDCLGYMAIEPDADRSRVMYWDGTPTIHAKKRYKCLLPKEAVAKSDEKYLANVLARIYAEKKQAWNPVPVPAPQTSAPVTAPAPNAPAVDAPANVEPPKSDSKKKEK